MCVTSNFDLEVIQGRQSAVERILLYDNSTELSPEPDRGDGQRAGARGGGGRTPPGSQAQGERIG